MATLRRSAPAHRRCSPTIDGLEGRVLLSTASQQASQIALVQHEYDGFVGELKSIELKSQATSAEYLALRDDARSISGIASAANLPLAAASQKAVSVSIQIDLSALEGWLGQTGWNQVQQTLDSNLAALDVPQTLAAQTLADMKALAASAGVTALDYASYSSDLNHLRDGEGGLQGGFSHFPDPSVYYTQHLRGFFRGGASNKASTQATLSADLASIGSGHGGSAVLHRDTQLLESIGAGIPSTANVSLGNAYIAAFDAGSPTSSTLTALGNQIETILGNPGAKPSGSVARLLSDAPGFYRAVGSNPADVETLVLDVRSVVDAGGDSRLNPFVVQVK